MVIARVVANCEAAEARKLTRGRRMKRFGLALSAACVLALAVTGTAAAHGDDNYYVKNRDWVVGSIKRTSYDGFLDQHFTIAAWETRNGANGIYIANYKRPDGTTFGYVGRVTCINVVGKNAMVGIAVVKTSFPNTVVGQGGFVRVTDYGPASVVGQRDSVSPSNFLATPPTVCPESETETTPTYAGNIVVHDGDL
jgi:hypothetical protein